MTIKIYRLPDSNIINIGRSLIKLASTKLLGNFKRVFILFIFNFYDVGLLVWYNLAAIMTSKETKIRNKKIYK